MNCNQNELKKWQAVQQEATLEKVYGNKRVPIDPFRDKQYEYERKKKQLKFWHTKEDNARKRIVQKRFRGRWRSEKAKGDWHIPVIHEYHTSGYETW
ncbi:hypothetical protein [Bacillus massiliigorillae]|uniref:hypothetical protein n=1 Tax=Bacillus massiliigorillae TaxID=1243664 RepID=UPI0003A40944|nr:hypothetical protein [Bacillus massiliigorillae]